MNSQNSFQLNQLRRQIAMQEVLQEVHPPPALQEMAVCPHCCQTVRKPRRKTQQIFQCNQCQQQFQQQLPIRCDCSTPGSMSLCQYCPHFQQILSKVQQRVEELRPLGFAELKRMESQLLSGEPPLP